MRGSEAPERLGTTSSVSAELRAYERGLAVPGSGAVGAV